MQNLLGPKAFYRHYTAANYQIITSLKILESKDPVVLN